MNDLQVFSNSEFGQVRTVTINDEPWFVGKDVAEILGYTNTKDALAKHIDEEDKIMGSQNATPSIQDSLGRTQYPTWVNESGLYSLILSSKMPNAKKFKHWVTSEVIPTIRKTGSYHAEPNVVTELDRFIHCAEIMANCLEDNRPYVLNILRNVVPNISEVPTTTVNTVEDQDSGKTVKHSKQRSKCGYTTPFNHKKFDEFLFDNSINTHWLESEIGCSDGCVSKWRYGRVRPTDYYRTRLCEVLGVPKGYFNIRTRKIAQKSTALKLGRMSQDNSYYIFGYAEEVDISPIGVNKDTGEVIEYFPPDHYEEFKNAKEVDSTVI